MEKSKNKKGPEHKEKRSGKGYKEPATLQNTYFAVMYRKKGSDGLILVDPPAVWRSETSAEENLYFHKMESGGDFEYLIKKCVIFPIKGGHIVRELYAGKADKEIYSGRLLVNA